MNINDISITSNSKKSNSDHIHEFSADTNLISICCKTHNHHLTGITEKAISIGKGDHKHQILCTTDNNNHFHSINIYTGRAIPIGNGLHVHDIDACTDKSDEHIHGLNFTTLINSINSATNKSPLVVNPSDSEDINPKKVSRSKRILKSPKITNASFLCIDNKQITLNPQNLTSSSIQEVFPGDLIKLQGSNYFNKDAKVIITSRLDPDLNRILPTIIFEDTSTIYQEKPDNKVIKDKLLFSVPEDLLEGIYSIEVQVENKDSKTGQVGLLTSLKQYIHVLPKSLINKD